MARRTWISPQRGLLCSALLYSGALFASPLQLSYEAPPECGTRSSFEARITKRRADVHYVAEGETAARATVQVSATAAGFEALLGWSGEATDPRRFVGETCDEVLDAVALSIAIALGDGPSEALPVDSGEQASPPPQASPAPRAAASTPPPLAPPAAPTANAVKSPRRPLAPYAARASVGVSTGHGPGISPWFAASLQRHLQLFGLRPSLGVGVSYAHGSTDDRVLLTLHSVAVSVEACPHHFGDGPLRFAACVNATSGVQLARSTVASVAASPWQSFGLRAQGRYALGADAFVAASVGPELPAVLNRYFVLDGQGPREVFRTPELFVIADISLGVSF